MTQTKLESRRELFMRFNRDARDMAMSAARRMRESGHSTREVRDAVLLARIASRRLVWWRGQRI